MTLVINVLHKSFSIMIADKLGTEKNNRTGDVIATHVIDKVTPHINGTLCIGISGATTQHPYKDNITDSSTIDSVIHEIDEIVKSNPKSLYEQQGIVTYFSRIFYSKIYQYSHNDPKVIPCSGTDCACYLACGSGNIPLESNKNGLKDKLLSYITKYDVIANLEEFKKFLLDLYAEINNEDKEVGTDIDIYYATKDKPKFGIYNSENNVDEESD